HEQGTGEASENTGAVRPLGDSPRRLRHRGRADNPRGQGSDGLPCPPYPCGRRRRLGVDEVPPGRGRRADRLSRPPGPDQWPALLQLPRRHLRWTLQARRWAPGPSEATPTRRGRGDDSRGRGRGASPGEWKARTFFASPTLGGGFDHDDDEEATRADAG